MIDFGTATPLRSQTLWHAVAKGVSAGNSPTLSFVRPQAPYVSIGYHRRLEELDLAHCSTSGLPVYRRMVGGGPVYLDNSQLFFQISVPMSMVPALRANAFTYLLGPSAPAFAAAGLHGAHMDTHGEIVVGDRKVCGHGAGQIDSAAVVVGNCIERFDHQAASAILALDPQLRVGVESYMRRYVGPPPHAQVDAGAFRTAAIDSYAQAFGLDPVPGQLDPSELAELAELDRTMADPEWTKGPLMGPRPAATQVKIRAGVYMVDVRDGGIGASIGVIEGRIHDVSVRDPALNGSAHLMGEALVGLTLSQAQATLRDAGPSGMRLAALISTIDTTALEAGR